jgi:hypothetical protein
MPSGVYMRFYNVDGIEMDVQDPKFFIDEEKYKIQIISLEEMLSYSSSTDVTVGTESTNGKICDYRKIHGGW